MSDKPCTCKPQIISIEDVCENCKNDFDRWLETKAAKEIEALFDKTESFEKLLDSMDEIEDWPTLKQNH